MRTSLQGRANDLALSIMKQALEREGRGELVIERGACGEHLRYTLTERGRRLAEARMAEEHEALQGS